MSKYITCEADLNFPVPNAERVTAQLRAMYDGRKPVSARAIAQVFGLSEGAIAAVLRRAENCGMVRSIECRGWIPLQT
jgi:predicted transcriptional regulator